MASSPKSKYKWPGKKILIVEDDPISSQLFNILLEKSGSELISANNGLEAVRICQRDSGISLVLMDVQLPVMDGYTATMKIKQMRSDLPVIVQTAYVYEQEEEKCLNAGFDGYLTKPIESADLYKLINQLI